MSKSKKNNSGKPILLTLLGLIGLGLIIALLVRGNEVALFNPKGFISGEQHQLMILTTSIMVAFAAVVLFVLYFFAWKYRADNNKAAFHAHSSQKTSTALFLWAIPVVVLVILASIMLPATHRLEPQDRIESDKETLTVQVVALRWKWLFIYPEQDIATVNFVQIPVDTPVEFELTADEAPMNSFWIPHLGGMLYAMTGHVNRLNLMADTLGDYQGSAAEISGEGFAGMRFNTRVTTEEDFNKWVGETSQLSNMLDAQAYGKLLEPSENNEPAYYASADPSLYDTILSKYSSSHEHSTEYEGASSHEGH